MNWWWIHVSLFCYLVLMMMNWWWWINGFFYGFMNMKKMDRWYEFRWIDGGDGIIWYFILWLQPEYIYFEIWIKIFILKFEYNLYSIILNSKTYIFKKGENFDSFRLIKTGPVYFWFGYCFNFQLIENFNLINRTEQNHLGIPTHFISQINR